MKIIKANITDGNALTVLTLKSKAYWGYTDDQIESWKDDLTISSDYVSNNQVFKLVADDKLVGFYAFLPETNTKVALNFLFVAPEFIGKGFGKILMNDFLERIKKLQYKTVTLVADPNAEAFYKSAGFNVTEKLESSIEGRFLPVMEKEII
jgi:ribosomal protein S18 acetylase RimI-like enzyme